MLAKVYVKPGMVNIIAAVHNGDLTHGVSMEVCDAVRFWGPQLRTGRTARIDSRCGRGLRETGSICVVLLSAAVCLTPTV